MRRTLIDIPENGTIKNKSIQNSLGQPFIGVGVLRKSSTAPAFPYLKTCETMEKPRIVHYVKWKQIKDFPDYFISNTGLVKYGKTIIKLQLRSGRVDYYWFLCRNTKGGFARYDVHRLVWDYFGSEPHQRGYEIHHKDHNPQNNHIDNLELLVRRKHRDLHLKNI